MTGKAPLIDLDDPEIYAGPHQLNLQTNRSRYLIAYGSRDSSKSYSIAQKIVKDILHEPYCKVVLVRKIGNDIRDSQYQTILDVIDSYKADHLFIPTQSNLRIRAIHRSNIVISRGLDKPTRLKSVKDPTIVWIEEANEITKKDFEMIDLSIRGPVGCLKQLILSFNPEDEDTWINSTFFPPKGSYEKEDGHFHVVKSTYPKTAILHTTFRDNSYCPDERKEVYKIYAGRNPDAYRTAGLGLWGGGKQGIIFENVNYIDEMPPQWQRKNEGYGLDFGFTNDPTALIHCCIAHGEIFVEEKIYKRGLVNTNRVPGLPSIESELERMEVPKNKVISADSAEPKSIAEISSLGYTIRGVKKPKGSVDAGIGRLKNYRINIVRSTNIKKEQKNYCYAVDKNGEPTNKPIDAFNHGWDGIRYWFEDQVTALGDLVCEVF